MSALKPNVPEQMSILFRLNRKKTHSSLPSCFKLKFQYTWTGLYIVLVDKSHVDKISIPSTINGLYDNKNYDLLYIYRSTWNNNIN